MVNEGMRDHRAAEREREVAQLEQFERRIRRECTFFGGMVGVFFFMIPAILLGAPLSGAFFLGVIGALATTYALRTLECV
jgi:hypothetical protein